MKKICFTLSVLAVFLVFTGIQVQGEANDKNSQSISGKKKVLVVYFSKTGSTREIAVQIQKATGGDIFEIQAVKTYPADYEALKKVASQELDSKAKPVLKTKLENIKSYDVVFIGYPIWWGTFPAPVRTFLSEYNLAGKTVVPFCTHLGSGFGNSLSDLAKSSQKSTFLEGLAIWGRDVKTSQNKVSEWLRKIKAIK